MKNMNIEAVLSYGKVFTGRKKYFFNFLCYFCMALFVVCLIITALIIISEEIIDENMIFCISVIVKFFVFDGFFCFVKQVVNQQF